MLIYKLRHGPLSIMDLHKYDKIQLHPNSDLNDKIKSLFLLFDRDILKYHLSYKAEIKAFNFYIRVLIINEEFEAVVAFKKRKKEKIDNYKKLRRKKSAYLFYRFFKMKLYKLITKI